MHAFAIGRQRGEGGRVKGAALGRQAHLTALAQGLRMHADTTLFLTSPVHEIFGMSNLLMDNSLG